MKWLLQQGRQGSDEILAAAGRAADGRGHVVLEFADDRMAVGVVVLKRRWVFGVAVEDDERG
jgi:hypothetical protein